MGAKFVLILAMFSIATAAGAQDGLVISGHADSLLRGQARTIYVAACKTVEQELGAGHPLRPKVVLVLGATQNILDWERNEIRLRTWDPYVFAQGVLILAWRLTLPVRVSRYGRAESSEPANAFVPSSARWHRNDAASAAGAGRCNERLERRTKDVAAGSRSM